MAASSFAKYGGQITDSKLRATYSAHLQEHLVTIDRKIYEWAFVLVWLIFESQEYRGFALNQP